MAREGSFDLTGPYSLGTLEAGFLQRLYGDQEASQSLSVREDPGPFFQDLHPVWV